MLKVYSAAQVALIFGLIPIEGGRGDDEFVAISKAEDTYSYKSGVDGEGTRSENKNNLFKVKITLMQTSEGNKIFSGIHTGDIKIPGGAGVVPILIKDNQGASLFSSPSAWITKWPDLKYAKEASTVEWEVDVHDPVVFIGGN